MQALFVLNIDTYVYHQWHGSLLTLALMMLCILFNTFLARNLPLVEGIFVMLHIVGILIFIPLWVLAPRREGGSPLVDFYNGNGWATDGLATMIGTTGPAAVLIGFDCSVHMGMLYPQTFCLLILTELSYSRRDQRLLSHRSNHSTSWIYHQCFAWIFRRHDFVRKREPCLTDWALT
jgi:hypothetical protein